MQKVKAKKYLGQHFLKDQAIAERIVDSLKVDKDFRVLEVGPGMGVLTRYLTHYSDLKLIEIDEESVAFLQKNYPQLKDRIIKADFLEIDPDSIFDSPFAIIGNFPYNISSQIFFKILEHKNKVTDVVCMLQREVARRIASGPGNKDYGILSVLLQAYFDIEYLFTVNEGVFDPPPKVKSGVIRLKRNGQEKLGCTDEMFKKVVKTAFNQRRKTLRNSLRNLYQANNAGFLKDEIFNLRPEQLTVNDFVFLAARVNEVSNDLKSSS